MKRTVNTVCVVVCVMLVGVLALAQHPKTVHRRMGVSWEQGVPRLSLSMRDFASADVRRKLKSGLPQRILVRIAVKTASGQRAVAARLLSCRMVLDVWDNSFQTELEGLGARRVYKDGSVDGVIERCLTLNSLVIGTNADYQNLRQQDLRFFVYVDLNPVSKKTLRRVRRWLARPSGGGPGDDAFFGSLVSLFMSPKIGLSERSMAFQSQPVTIEP